MNKTRCKKTYCNHIIVPAKRRTTQKQLGNIATPALLRNLSKQNRINCTTLYCNPSCKHTILQNGNTLPSYIKKMNATQRMWYKTQRNKIKRGKSSVLIHGFYEKIPKRTQRHMKKKGALSACTIHSSIP
jgi:hypothetical protein